MQPDLKTPFRLLGQAATIIPTVGSAIPCRVLPVGGGEAITVGRVSLNAERPIFHVLRSDAPNPATGDVLTVGDDLWTISAVEPVVGDSRRLLWQAVCAWGTPLPWTTPGSGGGSEYDPPDEGLTYTAQAASAGATTLTIVCSGWSSGRVRAGDGITVAGETYTATADVTQTLDGQSWVFAAVPITPALSASLSGGETVTFIPAGASNTRTVWAALADYEATEIAGGILTGDRRLVIRAGDIEGEPTTSDTVEIDGATWAVVSVETLHVGADVVAWVCQVRR